MNDLPNWIPLFFISTVLLGLFMFYKASGSKRFLLGLIIWTALQCILGINDVYQDTTFLPPLLVVLGIFPTLLIILMFFTTKKGRNFIDSFELQKLTYFHTIRVPVEMCLSILFHFGWVSVYMTVEGTNFDLFSGITAPLVAYFAFKKELKSKLLLFWNILCLLLLLNVVITAVFALPSPIQQLAFDQPNFAVLYFPYNLLPTVLVPLVFFGHLIAIRRILIEKPLNL